MRGWGEYVSVAERAAKARRKIAQLKKQGKVIEPVEIEGRKITKHFWGKQWCQHIETFSDYANRLPRGRSYVRNSGVCHLKIDKGSIEALVTGSSLYKVKMKIVPLKKELWKSIKEKCSLLLKCMHKTL